MSFVSPEFALLCLLFFPLFWALARHAQAQKWLLIVAGYGLYMSWVPAFALVLLAYSTAVWALARWTASRPPIRPAPWALGLWLAGLFLLGVKYYEFLRQTLLTLGAGLGGWLPLGEWATPVAVSFFTFQAITYLVAVGRDELPARSWSDVVLFLCFWPTLFAGPIWRATDFFAQRDAGVCGQPMQPHRALYLILLGLLQKLVLASWLAAQVVDPVYRLPEQYGGLSVAGAMVGYSLQIFFDFAGYTCIVTGLGLLLGYRLPENFLQPYLARNVQEFWTRWHVSLSRFIRDYIYIPMGGNRRGWARTQWHVLAGMLISGLWHGTQWTFVFWGLLHGLAVVVLHVAQRAGMPAWPRWLACLLTFTFVTLAWVFFRADDVPQALQLLAALWPADGGASQATVPWLTVLVLLGVLWWFSARAQQVEAWSVRVMQEMDVLQLVCALVLATSVLIALGPEGVPSFIYYRF